ncbi:hypothetical protein MGR01S_29100 [Meiothermus granaticius NBRC 107808]|nr:hypothetical protein MGR01S_29100 [Meiothermus granaticius NBRC 107808]
MALALPKPGLESAPQLRGVVARSGRGFALWKGALRFEGPYLLSGLWQALQKQAWQRLEGPPKKARWRGLVVLDLPRGAAHWG